MIIRKSEISDLERLYKIERECFTTEALKKQQLAVLLKRPETIGLTAMLDGEIVGFALGLVYADSGEKVGQVITIDVAVRYRRRGVGEGLLRNLERRFIDEGAESCTLEVRVGNDAAIRLYEKNGYVTVEKLRDYYSKGEDGIRLKKALKSGDR